jgi:hypothetical protein
MRLFWNIAEIQSSKRSCSLASPLDLARRLPPRPFLLPLACSCSRLSVSPPGGGGRRTGFSQFSPGLPCLWGCLELIRSSSTTESCLAEAALLKKHPSAAGVRPLPFPSGSRFLLPAAPVWLPHCCCLEMEIRTRFKIGFRRANSGGLARRSLRPGLRSRAAARSTLLEIRSRCIAGCP